MIKFFRKIRYNLMETGKTGKYLKYAIGEIILVVIGILIALQINNWNENRKARQQEQILLGQLNAEFKSNLEQLDQKIKLRKDMLQASIKLLYYIDYPEKVNEDSLVKYLSITQINPTFDPIVNDLASSGRMQLLQNQKLKEKLSRWTSDIIQVTEEEIIWSNLRSERYQPYLFELVPMRTVTNSFWENQTLSTFHLDEGQKITFNIGNSKVELDTNRLLNDIKFEGFVSQCASFSELINSQSYTLRNRIVDILNIIQEELEQ